MKSNAAPASTSLWTLFWIFFRIACTSFGGFMAMISVVQNVVVERRKLLAHQDMLDGVSLATILPGPVAVNTVAYVGHRLRGRIGAFVSVVAAVLPTFVAMVLLSAAYFAWGQMPVVGKVFAGFVPAVTAIIVAAAWNMGRKTVTGVREGILAVAAAAALLGIGGFFSTLGIILCAGVLGLWWFREPALAKAQTKPAGKKAPKKKKAGGAKLRMFFFNAAPTMVAPLASFEPSVLLNILVTFAGMSLMLFGGGYVFIPMIQEIVVNGHGWVTQQEFVDAVAMSQVMPGPILVSAAFIGLKVAGLAGALVATIGIFGPSAVLMVFCAGLLRRFKDSPVVKAVLRGVRPAVVGMIAAASVVVGKTAAPVWISGLIFAAALVALLRFRVDAVWIIPVAGVVGFLVY
jgi:chromate transporter